MTLPAPCILILTGASASGSPVSARLWRAASRGVHLRGDSFRKMIVGGRAQMGPAPIDEVLRQLELPYAITRSAASAYADAGFAVIYQDVILGDYLSQTVQAPRGYRPYVVVLDPSEAVIQAREAQRNKTAYRGGSTPQAMVAALREHTPRLGLWLDTSAMSVEQTADAIEQRLAEARVM